jgi:acetyl-CoA carboxylase carboxyltransferase component
MAHVPLKPVGNPRRSVVDDRTFARVREALADRSARLTALRAEARAGWGEDYVERVHAKGRLTARERIDRLRDPGSDLYEVGTLVNHGETFGGLRSPGAGVVTAFVRIAGRLCMVIANDNTVASGAWWPRSPEKIERAQAMALKLKVPTIYLVDCSGLFLPEQRRSFGGAKGAGHIFKMNSLLSDAGVPQIAGVFGDCIAGGGYMPIISDRVYMTEQAYMVIAGAALIKGAKSTRITSLDIGGPEVHVHESRCADVRVPDDETLLACIRSEVERLPTSGADFHRGGARGIDPAFPTAELSGIIPTDHREAYPAEEVLARLCDQSLFWEVLPHVGREIICGVGRLGGLYAGFIVNRQGLFPDPDHPGRQRPAGILYRDGIAKISAFSRACDADGIPFVWLQDIGGFDIGLEAERHGLLGLGSSLIYTNSTNRVPMFTVLLRKASGAGYYAMAGLPFDPVVQLSMPMSRLSVMEGRTLAIASFSTKLDDDFRIKAEDPEERRTIERGMAEVEARIEGDMDPVVAASQMDTDEIVQLHELRGWLVALVEMTYQGSGHRRIKNPRIWSLHDLALLGERSGPCAEKAPAPDPIARPEKAASPADARGLVFRAPLTGRLYFRPSPGEAPFVQVGDVIARGTTVCLLEAMKSFNRVQYGGDGLPDRARVVRFPVEDGADVDQDAPILELEPL